MTTSSVEKWPAPFQVRKVSESLLGKELTFFFITGVVNKNQYDEVKKDLNILITLELDADKLVISTLVDHEQLDAFYKVFERRSKVWRGQYYALAKAIVAACKEALEG